MHMHTKLAPHESNQAFTGYNCSSLDHSPVQLPANWEKQAEAIFDDMRRKITLASHRNRSADNSSELAK